MTRANLLLCLALAATLGLAPAGPATADTVYQIDDNSSSFIFNNTLGTETTPDQAEDNWVGNVFTVVAGANTLTSIAWGVGGDANGNSLPTLTVTAALYTGAPGAGLTLVPGSVNTVTVSTTAFTLVNIPFATPESLATGQVFTAALLIDNVPSTLFPFLLDNSGVSTGSYYDVSSPVGSVNHYNLASPNFPTLNGATYPGQPDGATNAVPGITILRVNAVPEPGSLSILVSGAVGLAGYLGHRRPRRRRPAANAAA